MQCECAECAEFGGPDPRTMALRFVVMGTWLLVGMTGLIREKSWKALSVMLGALGFFLTLPRYLICARCEGYGKKCYSMYLGKMTSLYLPKVEGKKIGPVGMVLEVLTLGTIANAPLVGLRRNPRLLALTLLLANLTAALHFSHSCRHCATYAEDWRRNCPSAKLASRAFKVERSS